MCAEAEMMYRAEVKICAGQQKVPQLNLLLINEIMVILG